MAPNNTTRRHCKTVAYKHTPFLPVYPPKALFSDCIAEVSHLSSLLVSSKDKVGDVVSISLTRKASDSDIMTDDIMAGENDKEASEDNAERECSL